MSKYQVHTIGSNRRMPDIPCRMIRLKNKRVVLARDKETNKWFFATKQLVKENIIVHNYPISSESFLALLVLAESFKNDGSIA